MDHHLGAGEAGSTQNCYGHKTVLTGTGKIELEVPQDRQSTFGAQLITKDQRRVPGFDGKLISMYARSMVMREITGGRCSGADAE